MLAQKYSIVYERILDLTVKFSALFGATIEVFKEQFNEKCHGQTFFRIHMYEVFHIHVT